MNKKITVVGLHLLIIAVLGCAQSRSPSTGSQTHFLRDCEKRDCKAPYSCICGVCTRKCESNQSCGDFFEAATCVASDDIDRVGLCEAGESIDESVCDIECNEDSDCGKFDENFLCQKGFCRHNGEAISTATNVGVPAETDGEIVEEAATADVVIDTKVPPLSNVDNADSLEVGGDSVATGPGGAEELLTPGCGDGRVLPPETCDIAIKESNPGYCPRSVSECPNSGNCVVWAPIGKFSECTLECKDYVPPCEDNDGCCPSSCSNENDNDCSARCGNGIVEKEDGETCEPLSAFPAGSSPDPNIVCLESCPKNPDRCVRTIKTGSPQNCNVTCESVRISRIEDGRCPIAA